MWNLFPDNSCALLKQEVQDTAFLPTACMYMFTPVITVQVRVTIVDAVIIQNSTLPEAK